MRIFISYGRGDASKEAAALAAFLREHGHEPWLDVDNGIPLGTPFDIRIEAGIEEADLLIALLSAWSLRPDGFCRNELLFAEAKSKPIIPVRIAEVTPPIQIISLNYIDYTDPVEDAFKQIPPLLPKVLADRSMPLREWPQPLPGHYDWWTRPGQLNSFAQELSQHGASFVGRDWLFDDLQRWINEPATSESRVLLLTATAGIGKSALAAQMTTRLNVKGVHFCSRSGTDSCLPKTWLKGLVYQLAAQLPAYRDRIERLTEPSWQGKPDELFRNLVSDPLLDSLPDLDVTEPWVFVVDGLDEAFAQTGSSMPVMLSNAAASLPPWLRLIALSRPDSEILGAFPQTKVRHWCLDAEDACNRADVDEFVDRRVAELQLRGAPPAADSGLATSVKELAAGNFLVARMVLEGLGDPTYTLDMERVKSQENRLHGAYAGLFRARFGDPADQTDERQVARYKLYQTQVRPILDCLVVAKDALPESLLIAASGLDTLTCRSGLRALSQFLSYGESGWRLFHQTVVEWLTDEKASGNIYAAIRDQGQRQLAEACWQEFSNHPGAMSPYAAAHLPTHLAEAKRWLDLAIAINSPDFQLLSRWLEHGETEQGIFCLSSLIESKFLGPVNSSAMRTQLARLHSQRGEHTEARITLEKALNEADDKDARRNRAVALHELGSIHLYRRENATATKYYQEALRLCLQKPVEPDEVAANRIGLATAAYSDYRWLEVLKLCKTAIRDAETAGDYRHVLACRRLTAMTLDDLGRYDEALATMQEALEMAREHDFSVEIARLLGAQGWFRYGRSAVAWLPPTQAMECFQEAGEIARCGHNLYCQLDAIVGLGWCELANGATDDARAKFNYALERLPRDAYNDLLVGSSIGLAAADQQSGRLAAAEDCYHRAIARAEKLAFRNWAARGLVGRGAVLWHTNRQKEGQALWKSARQHAKKVSKRLQDITEANIELVQQGPAMPPR